MTYRGSFPPGQAYNGQQQQQQQQMPQPGYVYGNGMPYGNPQYQGVPYQNPQMQHQQVYMNNVPQYQAYDGGFNQHVSMNAGQYGSHQQYPQQQHTQPMPTYAPMPPRQPSQQSIRHPVQATVQQPVQQPIQPVSQFVPQLPVDHARPTIEQTEARRRVSEGPQSTPAVRKEPRKSMPAPTVTRSPTVASSPGHHIDTPSVLLYVAEDCFEKATAAVQDVAASMDARMAEDYYKLLSTGLGCLEAALHTDKLPPRTEAKARLRYASILSEETENLMEAETALTKGIAVCEKHRFLDLKYSMQFLLLKVLFRRNRKAAFIAVDKQISESLTYKQIQWLYAFRFLRASFSLQSGTPADAPALENLRSITSIASHRQDRAIFVLTALLEGLTHLKSRKTDSIVRVQTCIAEASKYQSDPSFRIPQLEVLRLLLDLACDLQDKNPGGALSKMKALQARMDELIKSSEWDTSLTELVLPMKKQSGLSQTISEDTGAILRPGKGDHDYIVLSFVTKLQAFVLAYCFSGVALLYKSSNNLTSSELWEEALGMLAKSHSQMRGHSVSLQGATQHVDWAAEVSCYIYILIGLTSATHSNWSKVKECIDKVGDLTHSPLGKPLELLALYLSGCYHQGIAKLDKALEIFGDSRFSIDNAGMISVGNEPSSAELSVLAALNRLWIMQEPSHRNDYLTAELIEQLRPYCMDSPNKEIQIAWNLVLAAIHTNPALSINQVKKHIQEGLKVSQHTNNTHCLSIALNIMRYRLFENVVGDQAVKSARAGSVQAEKSGNLLWMSVADGMLSQSYEMQGAMAEAQAKRESGTRYANEALAKTMS